MVPSIGGEAGFLAQFALGALTRRFRQMAASGGNLVEPSADRVTVLREHRDGAVAIERDNRACAGMTNDGEVDCDAVGERGALDADVDDVEFKDGAAIGGHGDKDAARGIAAQVAGELPDSGGRAIIRIGRL